MTDTTPKFDRETVRTVLQLTASTKFRPEQQRLVREGMEKWASAVAAAWAPAIRTFAQALWQHYAPGLRAAGLLAGVPITEPRFGDEGQDDEQPAEPWIDDDDLAAAYAESGADAVSDAEDGPRPDTHIAGLRGVLNLERARQAREVREARRQAARYWQQEARTAYRERDEVRAKLAAATRVPTDLIEDALTAFCSASHIEPSPAVRQGAAAVLGALAPTLSGRGYLEGAKFERDQAKAERDEVLTLAEQALDGWAQTTGAVSPDTDLHRGWYERITRAADRLAELRAGTNEPQKDADGGEGRPEPGDEVIVTYGATYAAPAAVRGHYVVVRDGDHGHQTFVPDGARITRVAGAKEARS